MTLAMRGASLLFIFVWAPTPHAGAQVRSAPTPQGQNPNGMRIFIWAGLKSHSVGLHDYPQFLADWSKLLTERGAVVNGALHPRCGPIRCTHGKQLTIGPAASGHLLRLRAA